jgi:hypothetical protein
VSTLHARTSPALVLVGTCAAAPSPAPRPDEVVELRELRSIFDEVLKSLTLKEATIVRRYFGLDGDDDGLSLSQLGRQFGLSVERIRQIRDKALRALRHPSRRKKLAAYAGIHSDDEFDRFVETERAAYWAAVAAEEAARTAQQEAAYRAWEKARREQAARQEAHQEAQYRKKIEDLFRRIGDEIGNCPECRVQRKQNVAVALAGVMRARSVEVRSEASLFSYFGELAQQDPTRLYHAYSAWIRDVTLRGSITFTQGFLFGGGFVLYARGSDDDRCTWYLFDTPDGARWIGYADAQEALP